MARRRSRGKKYQMGGRMCGGPGQPSCNGRSGYRRGGRVNSRRRGRRFQAGGHTHGNHTHLAQRATETFGGPNYDWGHKHMIINYSHQTSASHDITPGRHYHNSGVGSVPQRQRGGRINYRLQNGGRANGRLDGRTRSQRIDNKGRRR